MKKITAVLMLTFISLFLLIAEEITVCLCPYNEELAGYLNKGLGVTVNKAASEYKTEDLFTEDELLIDMILYDSKSQYLLVPEITEREGLNFLKVFLWDQSEKKFSNIYTNINQLKKTFSLDCILEILPKVSEKKLGIIELENFRSGSTVLLDGNSVSLIDQAIVAEQGNHRIVVSCYGYSDIVKDVRVDAYSKTIIDVSQNEVEFSNLRIESNVKASVLKDSVILGETPFTLDSYTVPSVLRLRADGFSDSIVNIQKETDSIKANLKPSWMENGDVYKDARKEFYLAFARSIIISGVKVVFQSLENYDVKVSKIGTDFCSVLMTVSIGDLIYDLVNYSRYAQYISP